MSNKDVKKFFTDSLHGTRVTEISSICVYVHTPREREREKSLNATNIEIRILLVSGYHKERIGNF